MTAYSDYAHDSGWAGRRLAVLIGIVIIHLLMIWAFASGLAHRVIAQMTQDVKVNIIDVQKKEEKPPPPPKQDLEKPPPVQVPPPIVNIQIPVEAPAMVVSDKPPPPPPTHAIAPPTPSTPMQFVRPPNPDDYYPEQSKRAEETGSVIIQVCVLPTGKLDGDPTVQTSSGYSRLDAAAVAMFKDQKYKAGILNGAPIRSCKPFKTTFKIKS
jgi:periplasmic protein TonB